MKPVSDKEEYQVTKHQLFIKALFPVVVTWLLIPMTFLLPLVDSTKAPYFNLTHTFSQLTCWVSQSGGKYGCTVLVILTLILLLNRKGVTQRRKLQEGCIVVLIAAICGGGGAAFNEHILKTQLKIPRPNIVFLAEKDGSGPLGVSTTDFYQKNDREARRNLLANVLGKTPKPVSMSSLVEAQWIKEVGYSFPSGHSFSAMFFATFLLMLAATYLTRKKLLIFYFLLPWALAVCYSRPILRLHTPTDITVGGLQGLLLGIAAWVLTRALIQKKFF